MFGESSSPDIVALCEANVDDSVDQSDFCVSRYLSLIQKDSVTYMHDRAGYMQEGFPFAQDLSLENTLPFNCQPHKVVKHNSNNLCHVFDWFYSFSVLILFPLSITFVFVHRSWCYAI